MKTQLQKVKHYNKSHKTNTNSDTIANNCLANQLGHHSCMLYTALHSLDSVLLHCGVNMGISQKALMHVTTTWLLSPSAILTWWVSTASLGVSGEVCRLWLFVDFALTASLTSARVGSLVLNWVEGVVGVISSLQGARSSCCQECHWGVGWFPLQGIQGSHSTSALAVV